MMLCPDCGCSLDRVSVEEKCPVCGSGRRSAIVQCEPAAGHGSAFHPTAVGESRLPDGSEEITVGTVGFQASSTLGAGRDRQRLDGERQQGEEGGLDVCHILRDGLNRNGGTWGPFDEMRDVQCRECEAWYKRPQEKWTDVNIATHLVADAHANAFDTALLMSADADLLSAVRHVKDKWNKRVIVIDPPRRHSDDLAKNTDGHWYISTRPESVPASFRH